MHFEAMGWRKERVEPIVSVQGGDEGFLNSVVEMEKVNRFKRCLGGKIGVGN